MARPQTVCRSDHEKKKWFEIGKCVQELLIPRSQEQSNETLLKMLSQLFLNNLSIYFIELFLLSAIYIIRKYLIRKNFPHRIFDGFTCFEMSWTWFDHFLKISVRLYANMCPKFCGHCISRTNARKLMKFCIKLHLDIIWCWLDFGAYRSRFSDFVQFFF